ncbi:MAG: amino acid ABC transporter permease [Anaerolineales bacterium]|nr:amino acid ABC transporter permease [Anaerolineales bacterium]MBS3751988.1 amino acid ABC transporter permease [Anaerolineales bacterium]
MRNTTSDSESDDMASRGSQDPLSQPVRVIPWGDVPWWAVIVLIVGFFVSYSMLTNAKYIDALTFILDMPWHKKALGDEALSENGDWSLRPMSDLEPGKYTFYVEFWDEEEQVVGRKGPYNIRIASQASDEIEAEPITQPNPEYLEVDTSRPVFAGSSAVGEEAVLFNDFSKRPLRLLLNLWKSDGLFLTIRVTVISFFSALILGLLFGLMRVADRSPDLREHIFWRLLFGAAVLILAWIFSALPQDLWKLGLIFVVVEGLMALLPAVPYTLSTLYVEVMRGLPMLVIVLYMGFAVTPALRDASGGWIIGEVDLRGIPAAIIGLSIGYGAYLAEIFRGGIESIPKGQMEAARSLGMNYFQAMRYVILPQAIRVILPPLGNNFIALLKDSSLISVIALPELLQRGRLWISRTFRAFEGYNSVAILYLIMTLVLSFLVRVIERRSSID